MGKALIGILVVLILAGVIYAIVQVMNPPDVVIYSALDQSFSEPLLREFQEKTGLEVEMRFDAEAVKTVGLVNLLIEEANSGNPKADVFWNNELVHTLRLKKKGVLAPYESPSAADIPAEWRDPDGYWTGFAARSRVFILNTDVLAKMEPDKAKWPSKTSDLFDPRWKGQAGVAKPLAGTTLTHMSVLWAMKGPEFVKSFFTGLKENEWKQLTGNAHVMKAVKNGTLAFGYTDTDDYQVAEDEGKPVMRVFPNQEKDERLGLTGCLVIPNSVCLVKGGPNPENGKKLIDYILSKEVEAKLAAGPSAQMPVRNSVERPKHVVSAEDLVTLKVDWAKVAEAVEPAEAWMSEHVRP